MQGLSNDHKDETLHRSAIERLARELNRPIVLVETVYEAEYARLKGEAKVPTLPQCVCQPTHRRGLAPRSAQYNAMNLS